jgi:multidrug efflux pump subunit AcrB
MIKSIKWMAHNHVAANLLMMVFIVGGLALGYSIKQEVFPEINLDRIQVSVAYPGAGPDEVEEGIILQIEENIAGIDGIKEINAVAAEGYGVVTAVIRDGEDADIVLQEVKNGVDRIITFPEEAEKPVISKLLTRREVASLVVYGNVSERALREQAEAMRDELLNMNEITQAELGGVRPYEISIEIPEANLQRYNLTLDQVARRIRQASLDLPGGSVKAAGGEILLRTKERRYDGTEYGDIVVLVNQDGSEVQLSNIATIRDSFEETDEYARFRGMPAAMVSVFRVGDEKPTVISDIVHEYMLEKRQTLPESIQVDVWNDTSELFDSRLKLLLKNASLGLILVMVILSMFLQMRLALWVMLGIPISFLGALLFMPSLDVSINMISLFAFIMALGIVVDDAIVVGENIFEHRQQGKSYQQAAVDGAQEVAVPVTFSILTSVAAFMPLIFVEGIMGKFIKVIPFVVISILMVSLVESLFVLPAHLSLGGRKIEKKKSLSSLDRIRKYTVGGLERFVNGPYQSFLKICLEYRFATLAASISLLFLTIGIVKGGIIKFRFMPIVEGDLIRVELEMPRGTPVEQTARIHDYIVDKGIAVVDDYDQERGFEKSSLRQLYSVVGGTIAQGGPAGGAASSGAHLSNISMLLIPSEQRDFSATDISNRWRRAVGELTGIDSITFTSNLMHVGANIDVRFAHEDFDILEQSSQRLKDILEEYPGVSDIKDSYPEGKKEVKIKLKPAARTLGITEADLGRQIRSAFYGAEALRLQRGRNEVKVMVRYPEEDRRNLWDFENMRIRTPDGGEIPLLQAAELTEGRGYSVISRADRKRVINVTASVDSSKANAEEIIADLKKTILIELANDYPGLSYDLEGEEKERRDSLVSMGKGFILAMFAIYALLAIPFRSYSQPFLIMAAIPFGMVGAVFGHLIMGFKVSFSLSILSVFGIVALSGVVVNDSLLLIDQVNRNRRQGQELFRALVDGGMRRFRPILLTSLTTFCGLMPMILETSVQAQFLIPMAISLGFGIMFATGITLLLIPTLYLILEDFRSLVGLKDIVKNKNYKSGNIS